MTAIAVRDLNETMRWANEIATASMLPAQYRRQPANLLFACEYADALGISRIHALTSIHVIDGKPTASAELMAAKVRAAGHKLRIAGDDTYATAQLIRHDDPDYTFEVTWTLERARAAGLTEKKGGNWKKYPAAMLRARAISEVVRMAASDVMAGVVYVPEELGVVVDQEGNPMSEGYREAADTAARTQHVQSEQVAPPQRAASAGGAAGLANDVARSTEPSVDVDKLLADMDAATTEDDLKALWDASKGNCGDRRSEVIAFVGAKLEALRTAPAEDSAPTSEGEQGVLDAEVVDEPQS